MDKNQLFEKFSLIHPEWTEEQVWTRVALDIQTDNAIESGRDIDPNDAGFWRVLITKAKDWLSAVLPKIYEKVKEGFSKLLDSINQFVKEHARDILDAIVQILLVVVGQKVAPNQPS